MFTFFFIMVVLVILVVAIIVAAAVVVANTDTDTDADADTDAEDVPITTVAAPTFIVFTSTIYPVPDPVYSPDPITSDIAEDLPVQTSRRPSNRSSARGIMDCTVELLPVKGVRKNALMSLDAYWDDFEGRSKRNHSRNTKQGKVQRRKAPWKTYSLEALEMEILEDVVNE